MQTCQGITAYHTGLKIHLNKTNSQEKDNNYNNIIVDLRQEKPYTWLTQKNAFRGPFYAGRQEATWQKITN